MTRPLHVDRHGTVHVVFFLGRQYVAGGVTEASIYSTLCGDKLVEAEVVKEGRPTCLMCLGQERA